jgi:hypothetical protein
MMKNECDCYIYKTLIVLMIKYTHITISAQSSLWPNKFHKQTQYLKQLLVEKLPIPVKKQKND